MTPFSLAFVVPLLASGAKTDVAAGASANVRAGLMTLNTSATSELAATADVTLLSGVRHSTPRFQGALVYRPSYGYQFPYNWYNPIPRIFHSLNASWSFDQTRRLRLSGGINGVLGTISSASLLANATEATAATLPRFLSYGSVGANGTASYQTGPRSEVGLAAQLSSNFPLRRAAASSSTGTIPRSSNVGASLTDRITVTRRDGVSFSGSFSYSHTASSSDLGDTVPSNREFFNWGVSAGWQHRASSTDAYSAQLGLGVIRSSQAWNVFPTAALGSNHGFKMMGHPWNASSSVNMQGRVDPLLGRIRPRSALQLGLSGAHSKKLTSSMSFVASTTVLAAPISVEGGSSVGNYETDLRWQVTSSYQFSPGLSLQAGGAWQLRGPHLQQWGDIEPRHQVHGFVSIRFTNGTDSGHGSWL